MKILKTILFFVLLFIFNMNLCATTELWNNGWKFYRGDIPDAKLYDYNDSEWEEVGLPHSFNIPYFKSDDLYTGYGWYRKHLFVNQADKDTKSLYLDFDGIFCVAEIYVNGKMAAIHNGGYTGFRVDLSKSLNVGDNVISVRVNNKWSPIVFPRANAYVIDGGIYRNVRLVKKNPVHIDWCGLTITTSGLKESNGDAADVNINCDINMPKHLRYKPNLSIIVDLYDAEGKSVATMKSNQLNRNNDKHNTILVRDASINASATVNNPNLWSPSHPYIYKAVCRLYDGDKLIDEESDTFGFRWFEWTADKGFFINGEHLYFKGVNVHQDQAGWGNAITDEAARRDVRMIKEAGFDMIRGAHYPFSPSFVEECDKQGILFWSELSMYGVEGQLKEETWSANPYPLLMEQRNTFERSALRQLIEMINIHKNHPSVFAWSMCSDLSHSIPQLSLPLTSFLRTLVNQAHKADPTRVAAIGGSQAHIGRYTISHIGDVSAYSEDGIILADSQKIAKPRVISEYGYTIANRPGEYEQVWGKLTEDAALRNQQLGCGQVLWSAFDYGTTLEDEKSKTGIVDYFRIPKRSWYWYRNEYTNTPPPVWASEGEPASLSIEASRCNAVKADGTDDVMLLIKVLDSKGRELSNTPNVHLQIVSGPGQFPTGRCVDFSADSDIRILDGKAAITIRSYFAGKTVVRATSPNLKPATVKIKFVDGPKYTSAQKNIDLKNANVMKKSNTTVQ